MRTSSCPGQETAACRPPGRGASLRSLLHPLQVQPGEGWEESSGPLKLALIRSQACLPQGRDGSRHAGLPTAFPNPSDSVSTWPSVPVAPLLFRLKSGLPSLWDIASTYPLNSYLPCVHTSPTLPQPPWFPCCSSNDPGTFHPRAFALVDSSPRMLFPRYPRASLPS